MDAGARARITVHAVPAAAVLAPDAEAAARAGQAEDAELPIAFQAGSAAYAHAMHAVERALDAKAAVLDSRCVIGIVRKAE